MEQSKTDDAQRVLRDRSPNVVAMDNLIRRTLRVSNPNDSSEVARALRDFYSTDREAMNRESAGLPFVTTPLPPTSPQAATSTNAELDQAVTDVERDLKSLISNALLKDIEPELNGWATVIGAAMSDGVDSARQALDPRQRDKAFAVRRMLGDYARIARFVGALTPTMNLPYRRLAQSLDEVAGILLVLMGEAIANIGFSGGRFLLQVSSSELQERRDAVIYALRNLIGSTQEAYGPNDWPRGLHSYTQLMNRLTSNAQYDLKTLFQENELARMMDDLLHLAAGGSAQGLRALGSTAQFALERFRRLIIIGNRVVDPESPPLTAFLTAIKLFLDAFENSASGYRLLTIARPPILFYGLYGMSGPDDASQRLLTLVIKRGRLAELLDCYMGCDCGCSDAKCQIILDKVLYDVDRSIDLYALGYDPNGHGEPERRAAAYGFIIDQLIANPTSWAKQCVGHPEDCKRVLTSIQDQLWGESFSLGKFTVRINGKDNDIDGFSNKPFKELRNAITTINTQINDVEAIIPPELQELEDMLDFMNQELCVQKDMERQWESLLQTMAPSCIRFSGGQLSVTRNVIESAIRSITGEVVSCPEFDVTLPPHIETSLDSIANDVDRKGFGR